MVSTCASCLCPIYPRRPICCGIPRAAPVCCLTSHLIYYPAAVLLALPLVLGPHVVTPSLRRRAPPAVHVREVTYLLTTVCAASCQPANLGNRRQTVALGGAPGRSPASAASFLARPLQQLPHERKNRAGAQSHNRVVPVPELTRKECPAPLWSLSPPAYSRLAPFGE